MSGILFCGLSLSAWFTIAVVVALFLSLLLTNIKTELAFLLAMSALLLAGVVDVEGAFGGFSSSSVVVVGVLFVVIAGLTYSGTLNWVAKYLMGTPRSLSSAIVRLMAPVALLSSILSNTTVVALFINIVKMWSRKLHISPSKLLIPLSYASGMGGICTLIGTPPNIIISGLYTEDTGVHLSIFTPTLCGLFCLAVGILSMIAMRKLLPDNASPLNNGVAEDFTAELRVPRDSRFVGNTLAEIADKTDFHPSDVQVIAIRHFDGEYNNLPSADEFVMGGDAVIVSGRTQSILRMCQVTGFENPYLAGVAENDMDSQKAGKGAIISTLIVLAMVLLSAFDVVPLLNSCIMAAIAMVVCRCCTPTQALNSINWNILIVFAGSVCLGKAMEDTGVAQAITDYLLGLCGNRPFVVLAVICFVSTFITELISNTAAGALFYPIAVGAATSLGANPLTFCVALMISVSSSFATPIGSPTHLLVFAPGRYRFVDFLKVGIPMNLIILAANLFITTLVYPL